MIDGNKPQHDVNAHPESGRKGKNDNWPGCTKDFVSRTEKRRKKNKQAKKSRKRNRKK